MTPNQKLAFIFLVTGVDAATRTSSRRTRSSRSSSVGSISDEAAIAIGVVLGCIFLLILFVWCYYNQDKILKMCKSTRVGEESRAEVNDVGTGVGNEAGIDVGNEVGTDVGDVDKDDNGSCSWTIGWILIG